MYEHITPEGKDPQLWYLARKRASFRTHFITYLLVIAGLWAVWYLSGGRSYTRSGVPWPAWAMFGWGIGVISHYIGAYVNPRANRVNNEYDKLVNQQTK